MIKNLEIRGIKVQRYNLKSYPNEFVKNDAITQLINQSGIEALPATIIDGQILKTGKYPTNDEIAEWLGISAKYLGSIAKPKRTLSRPSGPAGGSSNGGRL